MGTSTAEATPASERGRIGVIRHSTADYEIYRYFPAAGRVSFAPWKTAVSLITQEEVEWLAERMPEMGLGEVLELLSEPEGPGI